MADTAFFRTVFSAAVILALTTPAMAGAGESTFTVSKTFQQGVDGYTGTRDTWLQVRYGRESWNAGGDDTVHTSGHANAGANRRETLIRFEDVFGPDGIPAEITAADIVSATLTMTAYKGLDLNDLRVYAFVTPWSAGNTANGPAGEGESTAAHRFHRAGGVYAGTDHWGISGVQNTFPTMDDVSHVVGNLHYNAQIDAFGPVDYMTDGSKNINAWPVDLDVTIAVRGWLDGTIENHGFLLRSHGSTWQTYDLYSSLYPNVEWRPRLTIKYLRQVPSFSLDLKAGYQFISASVEPEKSNLRDDLFASLIDRGSLRLVRDSFGQSLQRVAGNWLNPIGDWNPTAGYLVHMDEDDRLWIEGEAIHPQTPIELVPGYQFIAYLPHYRLTAGEAFASLKDQGLVSVFDSAGRFLRRDSGHWVDTIGDMHPGQGYLVRMSKPGVLVYPEGRPLTIVADGEAGAVVVTAVNPNPVAQLAAAELVDHIEKATGAALEVVTEADASAFGTGARIFIGETEAAAMAGLNYYSLAEDVFFLRNDGSDYYIVGRENSDGYSRNSGRNGTLYGVYEFLERELGVRWLWPGEGGVYVPRRVTLQVPTTFEVVEMDLLYRSYRIGHITGQRQEYQSRLQRLAFTPQGLAEYDQALDVFLRRHRLGNSTPMPWIPHQDLWQTYGADHPEWFKMNASGLRVGPTMCVTNTQLHEFQTEPQPGSSRGLYHSRVGPAVNLGEADRRVYCHCQPCLAWDEPQPAGWPHHITSNRYARYAAAVRDLGRIKNPDLDFLVTMFIYMDYFHAPTIDIDLSGVYGAFCPWFSGFNPWYPMSAEAHQLFMDTWLGWKNTGMRMYYRPNYLLNGYVMPQLSTWQVGEMLRFVAAHGSTGIDSDSLHAHWAVKGPMLYLEMRLAANPNLEIVEVRNEYFAAFGPAATKVEEYFDYWEVYSQQISPQGGVARTRVWQADQLYPPQSFQPARQMLDEALATAAGSDNHEYADRIVFLQTGLEHARLAAHFISLLQADGRAPPPGPQFAAAREALLELIEFRRAHEHLFFADFIAAAINEDRSLEMDPFFD